MNLPKFPKKETKAFVLPGAAIASSLIVAGAFTTNLLLDQGRKDAVRELTYAKLQPNCRDAVGLVSQYFETETLVADCSGSSARVVVNPGLSATDALTLSVFDTSKQKFSWSQCNPNALSVDAKKSLFTEDPVTKSGSCEARKFIVNLSKITCTPAHLPQIEVEASVSQNAAHSGTRLSACSVRAKLDVKPLPTPTPVVPPPPTVPPTVVPPTVTPVSPPPPPPPGPGVCPLVEPNNRSYPKVGLLVSLAKHPDPRRDKYWQTTNVPLWQMETPKRYFEGDDLKLEAYMTCSWGRCVMKRFPLYHWLVAKWVVTIHNTRSENCTYSSEFVRAFYARGCIREGTQIITRAGIKRIELLKKGDEILSLDGESFSTIEEVVEASNSLKEVIEIKTKQNKLVVSLAHPIFTVRGPVQAQFLKVGDRVIEKGRAGGASQQIISLMQRKKRTGENFYNLELKRNDTSLSIPHSLEEEGFFAAGIGVGDRKKQEELQKNLLSELLEKDE